MGTKRWLVRANNRLKSRWAWLVIGLIVGLCLGAAIDQKLPLLTHWAPLGGFLVRFTTSAGMGAVATIIAATVAVSGVRRQLRQSASTAAAVKNRETFAARDAEWWKSFEWTTARLYPSAGSVPHISLKLAAELLLALRSRARTEAQYAPCDALYNELRSAPGVSRDPRTDPAAEPALASYMSQATETPPRRVPERANLAQASGLLFELQCQRAFEQLVAEGVIDETQSLTDAHDTGADAILMRAGERIAVEIKDVRAKVYDPSNAARQVARAANGGRALLIVRGAQVAAPGAGLPPGVALVTVPLATEDVVGFLVDALRGPLSGRS